MAQDTPKSLRTAVLYSIYVRNYSREGTFNAVTEDLERIKDMGVDIIWFMPIHPIGKLNKKGSLGCPYSISDYRSVNPEYGTLEDFKECVESIHGLGMKVMIDVVYNHTAHDSLLVKEHPGFFHQDENGNPVTTVPDWSDVIDLKHPNRDLTRYLIDSLKYWVSLGVDGFRCDVASLVPAEFWQQARREVEEVRPGVIWLAESVHAGFVEYRRSKNLFAISDSEIYSAFDMTYDYDIWPIFNLAVTGKLPVKRLLEMYRFQHAIYPQNYIKMHCVENHDQPRIRKIAADKDTALAWTAFQAFNDGAWLVYMGQEDGEDHTPSLFDRDLVRWKGHPYREFLTRLNLIKKHPVISQGNLTFIKSKPAIQAAWQADTENLYGVFNIKGRKGSVKVKLPDGKYMDLISGKTVKVKKGKMDLPGVAVIVQSEKLLPFKQLFCELLS